MDLYYDILLAATPEGCPEPPRSDFYNEMVDQLCRKALRDIRKIVSEEPSGEAPETTRTDRIWRAVSPRNEDRRRENESRREPLSRNKESNLA